MVTTQPLSPPTAVRRFRIDRKLDRDQLRHVTALSTGRTLGRSGGLDDAGLRSAASARAAPGRYEIVSMNTHAYVFDNETSRFADVRANDWREQLSAVPQPPADPPTADGTKKAPPRRQRNVHGRLKAMSVLLHEGPFAALGKPDDTFQWPVALGGAAVAQPKPKDQTLEARLKLPKLPAGVDSQRHGRLVREGAPESGAVVMYHPACKVERAHWSKFGGKGWPKLARLKRFQVQPAGGGEKSVGKATIELLLDGTVIDSVDMPSLTAEPQPRWSMREAAVAAAAAAGPRYPGWNPEMQAQKQKAAVEAGYAESVGMEIAKDDEEWKAELAAREWEQAVFDMQEEDWERLHAEEWGKKGTDNPRLLPQCCCPAHRMRAMPCRAHWSCTLTTCAWNSSC
jgi:hypothetical protein